MQLTKKHILAFLKEVGGTIHFAGILREFGGRHIKRELKNMLDDMANDGELTRYKGNSYSLAAASVTTRGKLSVHRDGYGFLTPDKGGEDVFIPQRQMKGAMNGDTVEAIVGQSRFKNGKKDGRITTVVERATARIVGRYEENRRGAIVIPEDERLNLVVSIPAKGRGKAEDGQQVVAELVTYPIGGKPAEGRVVEVLGWPDDPEVEIQSVIRRFDLPHQFLPQVMAAAETTPADVSVDDLENRVDLRKMPTVTIDGDTARDFDDAVSLKREGDCFRLWVSIADVSHYVSKGSLLDQEAYLRGTSVYFPDRCIPMLPERLSNGICSLNPNVDRLTITAEMLFDRSGMMLESTFYPSVIKSCARLTYTIVKQIIVDADPEVTDKHRPLVSMLSEMKELALILMQMRKTRGSIDFDLPEPEIIIGANGQTEGIIRAERNLAHQLIEEFMLAANEAVARFVTSRNVPFLYRVHENPDPAKLHDFQDFIYGFGYEFSLVDERVKPSEIQRLLLQAEGKPEERMLNYALLRCMKQARYTAENLGHFGLASGCYCHFTSPIRRYPDLVVHRILKTLVAIPAGTDLNSDNRTTRQLAQATEKLGEVAEHTSKRERVAMEAERDVVEMKKLQYMLKHVGADFDGYISGVTGFGFFVELNELFVEGLVHLTTLNDDLYSFDEKRHSLVGRRTARIYRIGDQVRVTVAAVSPATRRIEFVTVAHSSSQTVSTPSSPGMHEEYARLPVKGKSIMGLQKGKTKDAVDTRSHERRSTGRNKKQGKRTGKR